MTDWFTTFDGLLSQTWGCLTAGVADRDHPARQPTFATTSPDGWPEARTVVLRAADRASARLEVHTDLYSSKITSLRANSRAAFHIWIADLALQLRLQTEVRITSGDAVADTWAKVPDPSRQSYGVTPPPGVVIENALDYVKAPDPATFAVLTCDVQTIDVVHLGAQHRRASFTRSRDWQGQWLSP